MIRYLNWNEVSQTWTSEMTLWVDVYDIIEDLLSGARNPEEWGDHPFDVLEDNARIQEINAQLQKNLEKMSQTNKKKLVEVMILMGDDKFTDKKTVNKDIRITVEDIRTIAKHLRVEMLDMKE